MTRKSVVIVGGGVSGLAAAWELAGGARGPNGDGPRVALVEASAQCGGCVRAVEFAGQPMDGGPDGVLARRPEVLQLADELGLSDRVVPIDASGAWLFLDGHLDPVPSGAVMGVPTSSASLRALRHLPRRARLALWRDAHIPRRLSVGDDATIGEIVRTKLGPTLSDKVVEPMVGGIQAGRIDDLSAREVFPALLAAARRGGSLTRALAAPPSTPTRSTEGPTFVSLQPCLATLVTELVSQLERRGVLVSVNHPVTGVVPTPASAYPWEVDTATDAIGADAVVLAVPPRVAAHLVGGLDPALGALGAITAASCAMVTVLAPTGDVGLPPTGTGVLVPLGTPGPGGEPMIVTAVTFLDRKWPHLTFDGRVLVRAHVGRIDDTRAVAMADDDLVARVRAELCAIFGRFPAAGVSRVERFPDALPQYRVGHGALVAAAQSAARDRGLFLAGNALDGVGVPAAIHSGRAAAREALLALDARRTPRVEPGSSAGPRGAA